VLVFAYIIGFMVVVCPLGLIAFLFYMLGLRKPMTQVIYRFAQFWGRSTAKLCGAKVIVTGKENIIKKGSVCFVSNHCGYFDILLLLGYCGRPFGFVAKKELLFVPFLNCWIYMLGGLFIDRGNVRKAINTIKKGVLRIKSGGGMLIFPEGHRSKGRGLLPFHPGALKLATSAEAPIVPVAIKGSYDIFEKNYRVGKKTEISLSFLPVIDTASLSLEERKLALSDRIYSVIEDELKKLYTQE